MSFVSSLEVGDVIWGGGYGSCQCCLCVDGYCQQFFFNLHLCFSYLGIRSAMREVFFRTSLIFLSRGMVKIHAQYRSCFHLCTFPSGSHPPLDTTVSIGWGVTAAVYHSIGSFMFHLTFCFYIFHVIVIDCVIFSLIHHP